MLKVFEAIGQSLKDLIQYISEHLLPIALLVTAVSWVVVLAPPALTGKLAIADLLLGTKRWFGLAALISTVLSVCLILHALVVRFSASRKRHSLIANLTSDEVEALRRFTSGNKSVATFSLYDGIPFSLIDKEILRKADSLPNAKQEQDFIIESWVLSQISKDVRFKDS